MAVISRLRSRDERAGRRSADFAAVCQLPPTKVVAVPERRAVARRSAKRQAKCASGFQPCRQATLSHAAAAPGGFDARRRSMIRLRDNAAVLLEWNDQLNARLAVVGAYFGGDVRNFLDQLVYEAFKETGQHVQIGRWRD
jgi:hypothetical protein